MSMSQASETEKMQMKILSDKQSKNGDEQQDGMSVSDVPNEDFADPAILVIREIVKISYSKDELLKLREAPLSKKKPDFIDPAEISPSIWDPEKWGIERKKSDTPIENGPRPSGDGASAEHRRRPGDPRERIRKENDGIVLSPQRRSFNSGCFVPVRCDITRTNRSHSPLGAKNEAPHIGIREIQSNTRRIGSGRILRDSWDFNDKLDSGDNEYNYRSQRNNNDDKFERRSFGRDFDMTRDRENNNKDTRRMNKGFDRRRISDNREQEEPEWFSGGPLSQNDTIELRGFDDDTTASKPVNRKKSSSPNLKRAKETKKKMAAEPPKQVDGKTEEETRPVVEKKDAPPVGDQKKEEGAKVDDKDGQQVDGEKAESESVAADEHSFNFDEILKCETIPGLLTNGIGSEGDNAKSRFSRWFKQESPEKTESRRSSLHEDHHIIKNLLKDIGETSVTIPGDSEAYFAPISPAANTGGKKEFQPQSQPINIMEILQRGKQQQQASGETVKQQSIAGKILSLDELEAKIRQNVEASTGMSTKHHQKPDEDMAAAFKKLLEQAQSGGHPASNAASANKTQPMSLLEMLNHSQQQDEAARLSGSSTAAAATSHLLPGAAAAANINLAGLQQHHPNDLTLKLQQAQFQQQKQQMEMLNKLINATTSVHPQQLRASPLHDLVMQQSRDLLNRPEAQAILQGLKRGEITTQHLYQQLANPALQPRHRDMLMTILKMNGNGGGFGPSPRVLSPVPPPPAPHHIFQQQQQQQQQLRVSPLPPNAMHQRIPSPRELQVHTQNILQRALIKKKLEEQQENYRKKQEMQRGQSPSSNASQTPAKNVTSPTPLAFTPTSVLRKMTAEKEEGKENKVNAETKVPAGRALTGMRPQQPQPVQQWNPNAQYMSAKHPGRPIVKANSNFQSPMTEQFFAAQVPPAQQQQQQQQQQAMQQQRAQQQQQQQLAYQQQQQQRKALNSQYPTNQSQYNPQQYSSNQQFTQQQLRAQHQHRPANQPQQQQQQQPINFQQQQNNQQQLSGGNLQQFFNNAHPANRNFKGGMEGGDGNRAQSVNQLARWFSPDLLERARGGELPSTAGLSQHVLSLEEIERQTAPPVHN